MLQVNRFTSLLVLMFIALPACILALPLVVMAELLRALYEACMSYADGVIEDMEEAGL